MAKFTRKTAIHQFSDMLLEVKSNLNRQRMRQGIQNIASAKSMRKFPKDRHPATLGVLFAYRTKWAQIDTFLSNFCTLSGEAPPEHQIDLVICLQPGFLLASTNSLGQSVMRLSTLIAGQEIEKEGMPAEQFCLIRPFEEWNKENILLLFYLLVSDYLNGALGIGVNMAQYTQSPYAYEWRLSRSKFS